MCFADRRTGQDHGNAGEETVIVQPQQRNTARAALESGDELVQHLCIAKYALAAGDTDRAIAAVDAALEISRRSLSDLLDISSPSHARSHAGDLVRSSAAGGSNSAPVAPQRHGTDRA
jgi:hypothetical protein